MTTAAQNIYTALGDELGDWIKRDCKDELGKIAQKYPSEKSTFVVDWSALYAFNLDLAEDAINNPDAVKGALKYCIIDVAPQNALVDRTVEGADGGKDVVRG